MQTWLSEMRGWRTNRHIRMGYSGEMYDLPALKWTQSSFIQPQMMMQDRYFYDPVAGKYTVDRYVDDTEKRYGGIDSVLIWHTYTNIGVVIANQYDLIRDMPGGIPAVRQMVSDFHRHGVKVFFPGYGVGSRHTRRREAELDCDRGNDERDRSRRSKRRHDGWSSAGRSATRRSRQAIRWCWSPSISPDTTRCWRGTSCLGAIGSIPTRRT